MMKAVRTSETSVDNHFTRQYIPEDNSEHQTNEVWYSKRSRPSLFCCIKLLIIAMVRNVEVMLRQSLNHSV
jgi:hypothetical protein